MYSLLQNAHKVVFGAPFETVLEAELSELGFERYFLIAGPRGAAGFRARAGRGALDRCAGSFTESIAHVPAAVAQRAAAALSASGADGVVAFGGGASLDTAKAAALRADRRVLAIPTNFSGSEVTQNFGLSEDGAKRTVADPKALPRTVIYDPSLVASLSVAEATCSAVNAMAHAVEALYAPNANPLTSALAIEGVRRLAQAIERRHGNGGVADARCMEGAWLCGEALAQVGMGLHHRICHVLGGSFGLPHAATHTVMLPYTVAFNLPAAPQLAQLAEIFQGPSLAEGLANFARRGGAPRTLKQLGLPRAAIEAAAHRAIDNPPPNPRAIRIEDVKAILTNAWEGAAPTAPAV